MSTFEKSSTKDFSKVDINGSMFFNIPFSGDQLLCIPLYEGPASGKEIDLQELLESKDTHRPRALR